jgi:tetratricopeptide (TPR) repeat protein
VADPDAPSIFGAQLFQLRWHQGRLQELEPAVAQLSRAVGSFGPWRIALALLYAENGQLAQARAEIDSLAVDNFRQLPRGRFWMVSMVLLAQACTLIGDRERAAAVYELLAPFAERPGVMAFANVCTGSNERPLGILCTTLGRWDEAGARFERALARNRAMGALPWVARTQVEYADLLSRRDAPGDRERATAMNAEAQAAAAELGLKLPGPAAVSP